MIAPWCNGSTPVFGTVSLGSSPGGVTQSLAGFNLQDFFILEAI